MRPLVDGVPAFRRICAAVEAARHSVWLTVAFIAPDFRLPDGRGSLFDLLDGAVARGLDVRLLCWRPRAESSGYGRTFAGTAEDRAFLAARGSRFRIRWDRAAGAYCHHQKCWLVDAGRPGETAFLGGMNLNPRTMAEPGHAGGGGMHDLYVELAGPSATDVHHGFAQRWNEASERESDDGVWGHDGRDGLEFPARVSAERGRSGVQVQRMVHAGLYRDGRRTPGGRPFAIADGERSILDQYLAAIDAARSSIYIENQALPVPEVAARLEAALRRGVDVAMLAPAEPEGHVRAAHLDSWHLDPRRRSLFDGWAALGRHPNFTLAGLAARDPAGGRATVHVHGKAMLVDDAWGTIGSCNLHSNSLSGHTEMNAAVWDAEVVRGLRCALLGEHLGRDTSGCDDRAALRLFREVAEENRRRKERGDPCWQGLAFALDPAAYGA